MLTYLIESVRRYQTIIEFIYIPSKDIDIIFFLFMDFPSYSTSNYTIFQISMF